MTLKQNLLVAGLVFSGLIAQPAAAQTVELVAKDGSATVHGTLVAARKDHFVVRTNIGVVTFDRDSVICRGAACPVELAAESDMTIAAPAELADIIIPLLVDGFAEDLEAEAQLLSEDGIPLDGDVSTEAEIRGKQADKDHTFNIQLILPGEAETSSIAVQSAGNDRVFDMLASGGASLILSEKPASDLAVRNVRAAGGGDLRTFDQERVVAVDGYVVVTHPRNTVKSMSVEQVSDVISGKIDNWSAFGGPNHSINVYSFKPNAEAFHHINDLILKPYGKTLSPKARVIQSNRELTVALEKDRYGVGIVSYSSVRDTRPVAIENECGMIIEPTAFNIKTEEYTLQNRISAYSREQDSELVSDFLGFLDSSSLDDLVSKSGLISLSIKPEAAGDARDRLLAAVASSTPQMSSSLLKEFVLDAMDTTRLSTTLRFAPGSSILDNKARRDLARVLRYVDDAAPKRLIFAGFADSRGGFAKNLSLSESRARAVLEQLRAEDPDGRLNGIEIEFRGFGELGPVACNESFAGRATNRRVEIWAK